MYIEKMAGWNKKSIIFKCLLTMLALAFTQTNYQAELSAYPLGSLLTNSGNDIGLQFKNTSGESIDISPAFDRDFETAIELSANQSLQFLLPRKAGKSAYPTEGFHLTNGDKSGKGRIRTIRIDVKNKRHSRSWIFALHNSLQWQYIRFPEVFWLGKESSITLTPVELIRAEEKLGLISQIAFSWE